ncbi:hypothetical protein CDCA_CDCA09G2608 [Cyanidium caldarium]|uniref:6-phosphofructo-2-kinase domain-containing protein n=1 Tax=Cyanidium caldarium TaxID=2771 RepID=A0AAV9IXQ6_CYACA|nr:hypothetical protein CDCA_CDCA09G2608 [Cyanidium caldarium]
MKRIVSYNDSLAFVAEIQGSEGLLAPVTAAEADDDRRLSQDAAEADASPSRQRSQRKDASVAEPLATGTAVSGAEDQLGQRPPRRSEYGAEAGSSSRRSSGKLTSPSPQLTAATAAAEPSAPEADLGSRSPSLRRWPSPWPADACAAGGHAPPIAGGTVSAQAGDMHGWPMVPEGAEREWPRSQLDADGGVGAAASSFREVYIEPESPHAPGGIQDAFLDPHPTAASDAARYGASPQFMAQVQAEETAAAARPLAPTRTLANDAPSTADEAAPGDSTRHAHHLPEMARPAAQTLYMVRKLVIVMVGLPARGKSHIAQQLARYLNWLGHRTSIFNVGVIRRRMLGESGCDASFFAADNPEGMRLRWLFAQHALTEMLQWLFEENGQVGIFDATNSTVTRRRYVREHLERYGVRVLFLESIVDDERIVEQNILATKLNSPDYRHKDAEFAVHDFKTRLRNYEQASETITESEGCSFIQIIDGGRKFVLCNLKGHLQSKIVSYLNSVHIMPRTVYLSRHGESEWNVTGQLGGDPVITARGEQYAKQLSVFLRREFRGQSMLSVWCSQLRRTWLTVRHIATDSCICWRSLNEINAGICEGMTYEQIRTELPSEWEQRKHDKLRYRYPGGESYQDVIQRVEPIILEIERQTKPLLIVAHNAIIRSIYAFYKGLRQEEVPHVDIPLHTLIRLRTRPYGCDEQRFELLKDGAVVDRARTPDPSDSEGGALGGHTAAAAAAAAAARRKHGVVERVWFDDIDAGTS